jgi:hypothetical protein
MRACHSIADEGLADPGPWHGFCLVIEKICALHARDRGFTTAFMSAYPDDLDFAADREYALRSVARLARRAQDAGRLRPDFVLDDLILMLMANSGIRALTGVLTWRPPVPGRGRGAGCRPGTTLRNRGGGSA